jgi:sulfur-carrier protein
MSIKVRISPVLQQFTGGKEVVETTGHTTGECLDNLEFQFPGIKQKICDERGQVLSLYYIYVNGEAVYPEEVTKPLIDGDEMAIMAIMAGG